MKSIALIVDIKGWAFDLAANIVKKSLEDKFKVDIFYSNIEPLNEDLMKIIEVVKDYDIIHFFWRKTLLPICNKEFQEKLKTNNINLQNLKQKISTGIYDHLYTHSEEFYDILNNFCKKYVTSSKKLYEIYRKNENVKDPWGILGDTFDETIFYPQDLERLHMSSDSPLVLGWVGNSTWNNNLKDKYGNEIDFKGFHTILLPVVEELIKEGYNIETYYADKNTNYIPNHKMCDYYKKIDVYIGVSIEEGTPKPLLEAMGCGVPVIITDVGVTKEYMGKKQKEFILREREIGKSDKLVKEELKNKILKLYKNRDLLIELSNENYEASKNFNSTAYKDKYIEYFSNF